MLKLVLKGGRIIDPAQGMDTVGDVLVEGGVIAAIGGEIDTRGRRFSTPAAWWWPPD